MNTVESPKPADIRKKVTVANPRRKWAWLVVPLIALAVAGAYWQMPKETAITYETQKVKRGDIVSNASATGTLDATRLVTVGSEISGKIKSVEVEANDVVTTGQVLAIFDETTLNSQLQLAQARLASSSASLRGSSASYKESVLERERTETLVNQGVIARAELDAIRTAELRAKADLDRARAEAEQSRASFDEAKSQLEKAAILSPIDGVIMTRTVEPGQTVASSLQAPELFVVAEDLSKLILKVWVDEADVSVVAADQNVTFSVAAYPDREFQAVVQKINLAPTTTSNVVTYEATLSVDNGEKLLRPGMTANATIVTGTRADVIRVSNAALRFKPATSDKDAGSPLVAQPRGGRRGRNNSEEQKTTVGGRGQVYVLRDGLPVQVAVTTGRSDGRFTEIIGGDLKEGDQVITGVGEAKSKPSDDDDEPKGDADNEKKDRKKSRSDKTVAKTETGDGQ